MDLTIPGQVGKCYLSLWCIVLSSRLAVLDRIDKWKRLPAFLAKTFVLDENLQ